MRTFWISRFQNNRTTRRPQGRRRQPLLENLEVRQLLSTFKVTNNSDSTDPTGTGSLWQAIYDSNNAPGPTPNIISFDIGTGGNQEISVTSALPPITQPVVINGFTESGTGPAAGIELNGGNAVGVGLELNASDCTIEGLSIVKFTSDGVQINSASGELITKNYIGVTTADGNGGNGGNGVTIEGNSSDNTIGGTAGGAGNTISDNLGNGIEITGDSSGTLVEKNRIGTNPGGTDPQSNSNDGIYITGGSSGNTIGSTTAGAYNLISGNLANGVEIDGGSSGNLVEGNRIGTTDNGTGPLDNSDDGVLITGSSANNTIGGTAAGAGNVISGNLENGVELDEANGNFVEQNLIGTQLNGTALLPNHANGLLVHGDAGANTIGGAGAGAGNTISGNNHSGVEIASGASDNLFEGNWIGTNSGGATVPNVENGVLVEGTTTRISTGNVFGGTAAGAGNTISGNGKEGVWLESDSSDTLLEGNWIGTNTGGTAALANDASGVLIDGTNGNTIGGTVTGAGNTISGNWGDGVHINNGTSASLVVGNWIGTNAAGSHSLYNHTEGVDIESANNNTIGGTATGAGNTISRNKLDGIEITGNDKGNWVAGNVIDYNGSGGTTSDEKNGVYIEGGGAADNTIGGTAAGAANTISHNALDGVYLNTTGNGNKVEYDVIESNGSDGVYVNLSPSTSVIDCTIEYDPGWGIWENGNDNFHYSGDTLKNDGHNNKVHLQS